MPGWGKRPELRQTHALYHTPQWRTLRAEHIGKEPNCRECARQGRTTPAALVDHIIPHKGNRQRFFSRRNLQSLCSIHAADKLRIEAGGKPRRVMGADGWPRGSAAADKQGGGG